MQKNNYLEELMNKRSLYFDLLVELYERNERNPKVVSNPMQLHHKIPKFFFKAKGLPVDNSNENLVSLSRADHFLAHYYIWRGANEDYVSKAAAPLNFMLKFMHKGISTSNIRDEDLSLIENMFRLGSGNMTVKGTHWYNNGDVCVMTKECPEGFVPGRINHKVYAEIRLQKQKEKKVLSNLEKSKRGKRIQFEKAFEYAKSNLVCQDLSNLAMEVWEGSENPIQLVVDSLNFVTNCYKKEGDDFWRKLKYSFENWNTYESLVHEKNEKNRLEKQRKAMIEIKEDRYNVFMRNHPNHSRIWYHLSAKGERMKKEFQMSANDVKTIMVLAYHNYNPEHLGYHDYRSFWGLHKIEIVENLERLGLLEH